MLSVFLHGQDFEEHVIADAGTDYKYRVFCSKTDWVDFLAASTQDIQYTNFKSQVYAEQGEARADVYHDVWAVLYQLQRNHDRGGPSLPTPSTSSAT